MATAQKVKLPITDARMLECMKFCVDHGIDGIENISDWCRRVGLPATHISNIQAGERGFSKAHLLTAGENLGISMDYVFGFTKQMFRVDRERKPMDVLKEAVRLVEAELKLQASK